MADPTPVQYLEQIRSMMVERRRYLCMDRVENWKTNQTEASQAHVFSEIVEIQNCIAAIDLAIDDEGKPQGPAKPVFGAFQPPLSDPMQTTRAKVKARPVGGPASLCSAMHSPTRC